MTNLQEAWKLARDNFKRLSASNRETMTGVRSLSPFAWEIESASTSRLPNEERSILDSRSL